MKMTTLKKLWLYLGKYKKNLFFVFVFSILSNALLLFGPLYMGKGIDQIVGKGNVDFKELAKIAMILLLLYIFSGFFQWLFTIVSAYIANKVVQDLRQNAYNKLNKLPLAYFDKNPHGDLISRMTSDIDAVSDGLLQGITQILSALVIIFGTFIFMLTISPFITLIVVAITPICFIIAFFIAKMSNKMFKTQSQTLGELNGYVTEIIGNQKEMKAFSYEDKAYEKFCEINQRLYSCGQKAQFYSSLTNPTTRLVNNIAYVAVILIGGLVTIGGNLSVGNIASFLTYSNQFAKPINELTGIASQFQSAIVSARRVFDILDQEEEKTNEFEKNINNFEGNIEFKDVSFRYRKDVLLLNNLNLTVNKGQMIAIVGPTGAGKTTLVNLLMRFYNINDGHIIIDSEDMYTISKDSIRSSFGMVLQESWLFQGTIAENIAYSKMDATMEEIIEAAKKAHAHGFIKRLTNGYDTMLEEDGRNLSIGEKQLLTIARVMLMNPPMLILDEATSSIDTRTEIKIQKAFNNMMKGRTSFVIAHRLSTIKEADIILVLKDGDIIEQGNHEDLLKRGGFYHTLYNSQFSHS